MATENESNSPDRTLATYEHANKRQKRKFKESNPTKRKHTALTVSQKIEICRATENNPCIKNIELACRYNIGESTISDILKRRQHYLSLQPNDYTGSLRRERPSKYPTLEQALALRIDQATEDNCTLSLLKLQTLQGALILWILRVAWLA